MDPRLSAPCGCKPVRQCLVAVRAVRGGNATRMAMATDRALRDRAATRLKSAERETKLSPPLVAFLQSPDAVDDRADQTDSGKPQLRKQPLTPGS
jgi:hypothetical protein